MIHSSNSNAAESHIVVDHATGYILETKGAETPRQVASLTKIAAVLVILEWLDETGSDPASLVSVPAEALRGGANPLGLRVNDELSIETGLFAAMMASDNTSTYAVADAIGKRIDPASDKGGVAVFVARMNQRARDLGMAQTRFVNPHGLDEGGEPGVSTASDLARLAIKAHDHPAFARYCGGKERTVEFVRDGTRVPVKLINTNELVGSRGIDGTKTGTTRLAGPCLVVTATHDLALGERVENRRLVVVLLNAEDRFREAVLLLDRAWPSATEWLLSGGQSDPKQRLRKGED